MVRDKETKQDIHKTKMITLMIIIGTVSLLIGMILGMVLQQIIIYNAFVVVAPAFDGVEVTIAFNETLVVDEMSKLAVELSNYNVYEDPHNINLDATCPGRNTTKTVVECIREVEARANYNINVNNCTGSLCGYK